VSGGEVLGIWLGAGLVLGLLLIVLIAWRLGI
jgi:hypothetical protein